ncbi:MAG: Transcriptional regulator, LuxR family [Mycobacterium sp.]|jgi:hypothetical protein|nr:Transcriptional regulator, LuxR family [Mycobacterium sp.]MDT5180457.1 hypothetical protein [Mycobacterium sp.]
MDLLTDHLADARNAYQRRDWSASYVAFVRADGVGPMATDDAEAFATAAWRLGHANEAVRLSERVYGRMVRTDPAAASMKALDIALQWLTRGDVNVGQGWMDRARRLLAGSPVGATNGYLAYLDAAVAVRARAAGELATKAAAARKVCANLDDGALAPLVSLVEALDAFEGGRNVDGYLLVERAIPAVESGEVPLEWAGDFYGLLMYAGRTLDDPPRVREWTDSMARWCASHDATLYHRVLHVYRAVSEHELLTESSSLDGVHGLAAGAGFFRLGELRRRRGDQQGAQMAFANARRLGIG